MDSASRSSSIMAYTVFAGMLTVSVEGEDVRCETGMLALYMDISTTMYTGIAVWLNTGVIISYTEVSAVILEDAQITTETDIFRALFPGYSSTRLLYCYNNCLYMTGSMKRYQNGGGWNDMEHIYCLDDKKQYCGSILALFRQQLGIHRPRLGLSLLPARGRVIAAVRGRTIAAVRGRTIAAVHREGRPHVRRRASKRRGPLSRGGDIHSHVLR